MPRRRKLPKEHAAIIVQYLEYQFPWLKDDGEDIDVNGADVVEKLSSIWEVLTEHTTAPKTV